MDNSASSACRAVLKSLKGSFDFPQEFKLSSKESEILKLLITYSAEQGTFPQFSAAADYMKKHGVNAGSLSVYVQQLKYKGFVANDLQHRRTWELSSKVTKLFPDAGIPATTVAETAAPSANQQPELEGKFKELWDFLISNLKGNDVVLHKAKVTEAAKLLKCEESFIWDTVRRFESRGLMKRTRSAAGIVLTLLKSPPQSAPTPQSPRGTKASAVKPNKHEAQPPMAAAAPARAQTVSTPKGDISLQSFQGIVQQELSGLDADIARLEQKLAAKKAEREEKAVVLKSLENYL